MNKDYYEPTINIDTQLPDITKKIAFVSYLIYISLFSIPSILLQFNLNTLRNSTVFGWYIFILIILSGIILPNMIEYKVTKIYLIGTLAILTDFILYSTVFLNTCYGLSCTGIVFIIIVTPVVMVGFLLVNIILSKIFTRKR